MTTKAFQGLIQTSIVGSFFLKIFNHKIDGQGIPITGFEALITNNYYIIGNVFIWTMLLGSLYHLTAIILATINQKFKDRLETSLVIVINLQLFFGLFLVTFLGWAIEPLGLGVIGLIIVGAYIKYKYQNK